MASLRRKMTVTGTALAAAIGILTAGPMSANAADAPSSKCVVEQARYIHVRNVESRNISDYERWVTDWRKKYAAATAKEERREAREGAKQARRLKLEAQRHIALTHFALDQCIMEVNSRA
ncbi:hypothetical protein [Streptomyces zaomyceticus]|uniref:hypothetical protein n=1 Tax=Streptomyces zaomyceticus TaxID=68286 RepID=UPI0036BBB418